MNWIDIRVRKPTEADADRYGEVFIRLADRSSDVARWDNLAHASAWMPIPNFTPMADPPAGYRLADISTEAFCKDALVAGDGEWKSTAHLYDWDYGMTYAIPIDPPKPTYRPFANADEYEPFFDKPVRWKGDDGVMRVNAYDNRHVWIACASTGTRYAEAFNELEFTDRTAFGVKEQ